MNTTLIIVNHDHTKSIIELINSIKKFPSFKNKNIIFIQNKKSEFIDQSLKQFENIYLYNNGRIRGFAENINFGIKKSIDLFNSDYFLILNPDIIIKNDFLKQFIKITENNKKIGIIAPKLLNNDNSIQYSCRKFYNLKYIIWRMFRLSKIFSSKIEDDILMVNSNRNKITKVDWVTGAVMFFSKAFIEKVNFFDENNFYMYAEDQDICLRAWKKDFEVLYNPNGICVHGFERRGSSLKISKFSFYQLKSTFNLFRKHKFNLKY